MPPVQLGRYEVLGEVGRGGAGVVHRGRSPDGRSLAIKFLGAATPEAASAFEREKRLLETLGEEEGFVPILDSGVAGGRPYIVFPFLEGGTLRARLGGARALAPAEAVSIVERIARALGRAHALGIVHRDVKPENILFTEGGAPLVADLGMAKHFQPGVSRGSFSETGLIAGTTGYMSPEQLEDSTRVGPAADVFALGVVLHECLAGERPFQGKGVLAYAEALRGGAPPLRRAAPGAPAWLEPVVARALAYRPGERYPDGAAFARALARPPVSRRRRAVAVGGVVLVVALGAGGLALVPSKPAPRAPAPPHGPSARDLAERAYAEGSHDRDAAIADATKAIELDPRIGRAWTARARARMDESDFDLADEDAKRALALDPDDAIALCVRALSIANGADSAEAPAFAKRALELAPREPLAWCALAFTTFEQARTQEDAATAMQEIEKAIELGPELGCTWFNRAGFRALQGDRDGALRDLDRAIELDPTLVVAIVIRGDLRYVENDVPGVTEDADRLIALRPRWAQGHALRSHGLRLRRDFEGAVREATLAIEEDPKYGRGWGCRGLALFERGDFEAAIPDLSRAFELDPGDVALSRRGEAEARLGQRDLARKDLQQVIERWPTTQSADRARAALQELGSGR